MEAAVLNSEIQEKHKIFHKSLIECRLWGWKSQEKMQMANNLFSAHTLTQIDWRRKHESWSHDVMLGREMACINQLNNQSSSIPIFP